MEENLQEYKHRLNFCLRVVKLLALGEVHVHVKGFRPIYQVIKRGAAIYTFPTLEKFENFSEKCLARHTSLTVSDPVFNRRMAMRREQRLARANGRPTYMLRSAV